MNDILLRIQQKKKKHAHVWWAAFSIQTKHKIEWCNALKMVCHSPSSLKKDIVTAFTMPKHMLPQYSCSSSKHIAMAWKSEAISISFNGIFFALFFFFIWFTSKRNVVSSNKKMIESLVFFSLFFSTTVVVGSSAEDFATSFMVLNGNCNVLCYFRILIMINEWLGVMN